MKEESFGFGCVNYITGDDSSSKSDIIDLQLIERRKEFNQTGQDSEIEVRDSKI
jgi:hypothetical protein